MSSLAEKLRKKAEEKNSNDKRERYESLKKGIDFFCENSYERCREW